MTNAELDTMWFQAQHDAIKAGEDFTRYRFAALVAAAERAACAKVCDVVAKKMYDEGEGPTGYIAWVTDCAAAIRARGNK